jgi:hypothetical protein
MRHERSPSGDILDVGKRMGEACLIFAVLLPIGIGLSIFVVYCLL